jgi:putative ATP-dependent endonuclease of OLD family
VKGKPEDFGIFVGDTTLEYDLFGADEGNAEALISVLEELAPGSRTGEVLAEWRLEMPEYESFMRPIARIGKGRVAQRLAQRTVEPPLYVRRALQYLAD